MGIARIIAAAALAGLLGACAPQGPYASARGPAPVLLVGDSIFAWNGGLMRGDVGDHLSRALGRAVENRSVVLARVSRRSGRGGAFGPDVARQLDGAGRRDWIVIGGGGNDVGRVCGCLTCEGMVDWLISKDGTTGAIPEMVARARAAGARVIYVSYYGPSGRGGAYDICQDELTALAERAEAMAARDPGVIHFSPAGVVSGADPSDYYFDDIHPSPSGSRKIGEALAALIAAQEA